MEDDKKKVININILKVVNLLRQDKVKIVIYVGIAAVIGLVVAFTTPKNMRALWFWHQKNQELVFLEVYLLWLQWLV